MQTRTINISLIFFKILEEMKGKSSSHFDFQFDILKGHGKAGNGNYVTPFYLVHK
jgi:hypothetical protein